MTQIKVLVFILIFLACKEAPRNITEPLKDVVPKSATNQVSLVVLGNVQDAGSPHIACKKNCCKALFTNPDKNRKVVSLGILDNESHKKYLFEATPDIAEQFKILKEAGIHGDKEIPDGIFLTHAHIGHYTGLMYLGKEAMNASKVPVYAMPRLKTFLEKNGPWSQLVANGNITVQEMADQREIRLTPKLRVTPFTVPHRDEYSETVGYTIIGPNKRLLFIPDIDKWDRWETDIIKEISKVDIAFIDGAFYDAEEIGHRDISEIPHPFIVESMALFKNLPANEKQKVHFIHLNHTNPLLDPVSSQSQEVIANGFNIARIYDTIEL